MKRSILGNQIFEKIKSWAYDIRKSPTKIYDIVVIALFTCFSIFINGYRFGISNHAYQIPFLLNQINSSLFQNDLMFSFSYNNTLYYSLLAPLIKFINIEVLFFALYILSCFFYFLMIFYLAKLLFKNKNVAYLSVFFLIISKPALGGDATYYNIFYYNAVVIPFLLLSIYLFLRERYVVSFLITGLMFNIHALSSFYVFSMFMLYFGLNSKNIGIKSTFSSIFAFLACASPLLLWKLSGGGSSIFYTAVNWSEWLMVMRVRSPHHIFPFSWTIPIWLIILSYIIFWWLSFKYAPESKYHKKVVAFSLAMLILCILGTIFTELSPLKPVILLQFFRSTIFFVIFATVYISNYLLNLLESGFISKSIAVGVSIPLFFGTSVFSLKILLFSLVFVCVLYFVFLFQKRIFNRLSLLSVLLIFVLLVSFGTAVGGVDRADFPHKINKWEDVQLWCKNNTAQTDLFVTPPYLTGFRIYSERSIVGSWKDGTLAFFDDEFGIKWWKRMEDFGYAKDDYKNYGPKEYNSLTEEDFKRFSKKYNATHLIIEKSEKVNFTQVYENEQFKVYLMDD